MTQPTQAQIEALKAVLAEIDLRKAPKLKAKIEAALEHTIVAATIVCCAQVVDDFRKNANGEFTNRILQDCSAAIRKLKDVP